MAKISIQRTDSNIIYNVTGPLKEKLISSAMSNNMEGVIDVLGCYEIPLTLCTDIKA